MVHYPYIQEQFLDILRFPYDEYTSENVNMHPKMYIYIGLDRPITFSVFDIQTLTFLSGMGLKTYTHMLEYVSHMSHLHCMHKIDFEFSYVRIYHT